MKKVIASEWTTPLHVSEASSDEYIDVLAKGSAKAAKKMGVNVVGSISVSLFQRRDRIRDALSIQRKLGVIWVGWQDGCVTSKGKKDGFNMFIAPQCNNSLVAGRSLEEIKQKILIRSQEMNK